MHCIRRQILDLELPREAGAVALQQRASQVFQEKVLPRLDEVFNRLAPAGRFVRIERLDIDLGDIGEANWEQKFVERCVEQITREVAEQTFDAGASGSAGAEALTPEANALAVFQYFLETGLLPWHAGDITLKAVESDILELTARQPETLQGALASLLRQRQSAVQRLVWQFDPGFAAQIVGIILGLGPGWVEQAVQTYYSQSGHFPEPALHAAFLRLLLEEAAPEWREKMPEASLVAQLFFRAATALNVGAQMDKLAGKPMPEAGEQDQRTKTREQAQEKRPAPGSGPGVPETPDSTVARTKVPGISGLEKSGLSPKSFPETALQPAKKHQASEAALEGVFIDNAGVVLLGVYLPAFFSGLNLVVDNEFTGMEAQYCAVHLLHFLATGLEYPEEPVLVLPKILCGMDIDDPVPQDIALDEHEKTEAVQLLEAAVRNWPVLKNTGPDGLREAFLQRAGLLAWSEGRMAWLLRLERLGQDMLLERLPWSFSVVKLPWMPQMIHVEW